MTHVHATAVALDTGGHWRGVLLRGPAGSGKSDLALRLIDAGGRLVADDQCELSEHNGQVTVAAPARLAGLLEVRGLGIMRVPNLLQAELALLVDLAPAEHIMRLPEPERETVLGTSLPRLDLAPFEASAIAKLRLAVQAIEGGIIITNDPAGRS